MLSRYLGSWEKPIIEEPLRDRTVIRAITNGVYTLPEDLDVQAKIVAIIRRLDDLETKKVQEDNMANEGTMQP